MLPNKMKPVSGTFLYQPGDEDTILSMALNSPSPVRIRIEFTSTINRSGRLRMPANSRERSHKFPHKFGCFWLLARGGPFRLIT
jgi:hypothetical protein